MLRKLMTDNVRLIASTTIFIAGCTCEMYTYKKYVDSKLKIASLKVELENEPKDKTKEDELKKYEFLTSSTGLGWALLAIWAIN